MINTKAKGASTPVHNLLQFRLLQQALAEEKLDINSYDVYVDHRLGTVSLNGKKIGLRYPKIYLEKIKNLSSDKIYDFCFIGHFESFGREELLQPFTEKNSIIKHSVVGRTEKKFMFDKEYYSTICSTKYSLVPNHIGKKAKKWQHDDAWSYRFIETLFCKSIPVLFRQTPLGKNFIKDFKFVWNDSTFNISDKEYNQIVNYNYNLAVNTFTINNADLEKLRI